MKRNITKSIILGTIVTLGLFSAANAQSAYDDQQYAYNQPNGYEQSNNQQGFYYYPNTNVYYDVSCNRYIYNNGYSWLTVNILPSGICLTNQPRFMVYHRGPQVWMDNPIHVRNYYRPAYRQPIIAFNFRRNDFGGRGRDRKDFDRRDFDHRDNGKGNGRDDHDRGGRRW